MADDIVKRISRPGSPIILVFDLVRHRPISKYTKVGEICDFRLISQFISETVSCRSMVAMERYVSVSTTLNDLERRDMRVKFFKRISLITLVPFDLERPNSAV